VLDLSLTGFDPNRTLERPAGCKLVALSPD
jgi:hypothetical protein